jgi:hypothetical protein
MLADRAAAGAGEAVAFFEDKATMLAHRGDDLEMQAGSGGPGEMGQMLQYLSFGEGQKLRQLQAGARLLRQKFFHGLTRGAHENFSTLISAYYVLYNFHHQLITEPLFSCAIW